MGLSLPDANLYPEVEKGQREASQGPTGGGGQRFVCLPHLTALLGFSGWASQRGRRLKGWGTGPGRTEPAPGRDNIPIPYRY